METKYLVLIGAINVAFWAVGFAMGWFSFKKYVGEPTLEVIAEMENVRDRL